MYSVQEIAKICGGTLKGNSKTTIKNFLTDSRNLTSPEAVIFIAIKTEKNNGHQFIKELIDSGVKAFLVNEEEIEMNTLLSNEVSFISVKDTLVALQTLARHHRSLFNIPVIGITGSNGKTIVREWLYQSLKQDHSICRSPKSFNSQIGVPLSVLNLDAAHTLGIFEAGISKPGEMKLLQEIIQPTITVLTSLGSAHDEGFKERYEKLQEKLLLATHSDTVVINGVDKKEIYPQILPKTILLNKEGENDMQYSFKNDLLQLQGHSPIQLSVPFHDDASIQNIASCVQVLRIMGLNDKTIQERVLQLQPVALRLEIKNGIANSLIVNDFYNSDLDSLKIALTFLKQQNRRKKKAVVISDIEQSGMPDNILYREIANLLSSSKADLVVGIGKKISNFRYLLKSDSLFFENTEEFIQQFHKISYRFSDAAILLKGARSFGFEKISNLLQLKSHDTVFELNLNKLSSNINHYKMLIGEKVKLMCMVKAMGYGGGGSELARTLQHLGVHYLAVAYADEGVELRESQIHLPIMVMSPEGEAYEDIIQYNLEPEIYSFKTLNEFCRTLDHVGYASAFPIHLKLDTGMHRLGFEEKEIDELIELLKTSSQVKIQSVFSHLAASDNPELDEFSKMQINSFEKSCEKIEKASGYKFAKHICNSGAITRFKEAHFDMVRLGIGMHGIGVNEEEQKKLENTGALRTRISQIKNVKVGESVGYNRNGKAEKDLVIATIPIGYADGFNRSCGNGKAGVYIGGKYCKTIGNICMDMSMIDITGLKCEEGQEVVVFENNAQLRTLAESMGTITYEVLTGVSGRVKRVYVWE